MRARMSGFICEVPRAPASEPAVGGGLPRAALRVPSGVEVGFMFEVRVAPLGSLALVCEAGRREAVGDPKGGDAGSESEGDAGGDSRGDWAGESSAIVAGGVGV